MPDSVAQSIIVKIIPLRKLIKTAEPSEEDLRKVGIDLLEAVRAAQFDAPAGWKSHLAKMQASLCVTQFPKLSKSAVTFALGRASMVYDDLKSVWLETDGLHLDGPHVAPGWLHEA